MEMRIHPSKKLVEVWLTNSEKICPDIKKRLTSVYKKYYSQKFLVVVFESGKEDLYQNTLSLLLYNKKRIAEKEIEEEKRSGKLSS